MLYRFSSQVNMTDSAEKKPPVHTFAYQQPVDDPKNFCYIWVMHGHKTTELRTAFTELYSMFFKKKSYLEGFGYIYEVNIIELLFKTPIFP